MHNLYAYEDLSYKLTVELIESNQTWTVLRHGNKVVQQ